MPSVLHRFSNETVISDFEGLMFSVLDLFVSRAWLQVPQGSESSTHGQRLLVPQDDDGVLELAAILVNDHLGGARASRLRIILDEGDQRLRKRIVAAPSDEVED